MARRGNFLSRFADRIVKSVERIFTGVPRRAAPRETPAPAPPRPVPTPTGPLRRRGRPRGDPWEGPWDRSIPEGFRTKSGRRPSFLDNKDFIERVMERHNIPTDDTREFWQDYLDYFIKGKGRRRLNDTRNRFWRKWGIHPNDFDWWGWREAMGYPHGARSRG